MNFVAEGIQAFYCAVGGALPVVAVEKSAPRSRNSKSYLRPVLLSQTAHVRSHLGHQWPYGNLVVCRVSACRPAPPLRKGLISRRMSASSSAISALRDCRARTSLPSISRWWSSTFPLTACTS
jgi:hypothetical protein